MKMPTAKTTARTVLDPFETLESQVARPIFNDAMSELGSFFGRPRLARQPNTIGQEELQRARKEKELEKLNGEDENASQEKITAIMTQYREQEIKTNQEQQTLKKEFVELQSEVAKLAKAAGVETRVHLETKPRKIGILDIKRLTSIIRSLRLKAEESKSAKELVDQRANAKPATGMLAWVSGKQMKIHEQGTMQLQG